MPEPDYKMLYENLSSDHAYFKKKVKEMLELQQTYFKSHRDHQLFKKAKALESEILELITPRNAIQSQMDWLGQ